MARIHDLNALPADLQEAVKGVDSASGLLCPACHGGRSGERSLGFRREGFMAWFTCFRAGCGYRALVPMAGDLEVRPPEFKPRPYTRELGEPSPSLTALLGVRYGLSEVSVIRYVREPIDCGTFEWAKPSGLAASRAMYMPVLSPYGEDRGGVLRYLDGTKPKTVSYLTTSQPALAWYVRDALPKLGPVVIVEDQISAMRCKQLGYNAVALMGTNINDEKAREIRGDRPTLLALDKDAFGKTVGYARRWPWMIPVLLEHDIKDSDDADVKARLGQALGEAYA